MTARFRDSAGHSDAALEIELMFSIEPEVCAPERSAIPSRAGASGSHHLPWALPRVLQVAAKIKRVGESDQRADREHDSVS